MNRNLRGDWKRVRFLMALLVMLVGLVVLIGSGGSGKDSASVGPGDQENSDNPLAGRWARTDGTGTITFRATDYRAYNSLTGCTVYAAYTASDGMLLSTDTSVSGPSYCRFSEARRSVGYSIDGDVLTLDSESGESYTCIRLDENGDADDWIDDDDQDPFFDDDGEPTQPVAPDPAGDPDADYTNSLGMTFNLIPAGTFLMSSPPDEFGRWVAETQRLVTISRSFYIQTTEVTQGQWKAVTGSNPSYFGDCGDDCPVETVSWYDVQGFIAALNAMGQGAYRLPTEAEWEYAARAGSNTAFAGGDIAVIGCDHDPILDAMGWYCYNSDHKTHPVARKQPNAWGLYDMHGNVWEWCSDWFIANLGATSVVDPAGPDSGTGRVLRGGSWSHAARVCRAANRSGDSPSFGATQDYRYGVRGFRLVRNN